MGVGVSRVLFSSVISGALRILGRVAHALVLSLQMFWTVADNVPVLKIRYFLFQTILKREPSDSPRQEN